MLRKTCMMFGYKNTKTYNGLHCFLNTFENVKNYLLVGFNVVKALLMITKGVLKIVSTFISVTTGGILHAIVETLDHILKILNIVKLIVKVVKSFQ